MKLSKALVIGASVGAGVFLGFMSRPAISGDNVYEQVKKFSDVLNQTTRMYVENVDTQKLTEAAIRGMLNQLDPHSVYIPAEQMKKVTEDFQGSFEGIGVEFDVVKDTITIVTPISGGPSEALGIQAGDKIVKINDTLAIGLSREDVPKKLRGPKGTHVKLGIRRSTETKLIDFDIVRDKIPLYTVDASFLIEGSDVGLISINRFAATTHKEFMEAAQRLRAQGMKRLILDLRNNPGGYLDQAFKLADEFLPGGQKIVYTKGRRPEVDEDYYSSDGGDFEKVPLIIMVNGGSASASEIVSGAVQDLDRGLIVGETSFGKGLVQQQYPLGDGSAFRLTISRYYTPSGRLIQRPYGDKDKYYRGEGREDVEEGDNIQHSADKGKKSDSLRPTFKTMSGRTVYGGGGITPDYVVKPDTITPLSVSIRRKNLFWEFTDGYMRNEGKDLRGKYKDDFNRFRKDFKISDQLMQDFRKAAESKEITWNDNNYKTDQDYLRTMLKATIARMIFGNPGFYPIAYQDDKQISKALELFPEASRIAKLK
jgi:carboxyl-terminal processing protease